jgi:hypothetical protein
VYSLFLIVYMEKVGGFHTKKSTFTRLDCEVQSHDTSFAGDSKRLPEMFPLVAGALEQVCVCTCACICVSCALKGINDKISILLFPRHFDHALYIGQVMTSSVF